MEDTFESLEDDDLDELADKEVDKILFEVTNGKQGFIQRGRGKLIFHPKAPCPPPLPPLIISIVKNLVKASKL